MKYTEPHYPEDLGVRMRSSPSDAERLYEALAKSGAPLVHDGVTPAAFIKDKVVYQIGVAPVRIDIPTHIDGVDVDAAWQNRVESTMFGVPVPFITLADLIANKRAAGRTSDLVRLDLHQGKKSL